MQFRLKTAKRTEITLAWALSQPIKTVLLVSSRNAERMKDNLKAFDVKLTEEEVAWLDGVNTEI